MDVALALAAAFFFALGLVLQEKAASEQPDETVAAGFLVRLARQPVWLLGLAMQGVGFVAQAIAALSDPSWEGDFHTAAGQHTH